MENIAIWIMALVVGILIEVSGIFVSFNMLYAYKERTSRYYFPYLAWMVSSFLLDCIEIHSHDYS